VFLRGLASLGVVALVMAATPVHAAMRSDSTSTDAWRLPNGLEVRTVNIRHTPGVAVTLAFRAGSGYDPAGQEGLGELLAEVQFTSAAGDVPERTREEMASLRPLGWECRTGARLVRFTEIATHAQLPGVLQQAATRLAGVQVTDAGLKKALASVRRDVGSRLFGDANDVLYWRSGLIARGLSDEQLVRRAGLPGLDKLTAAGVLPLLKQRYQAGNASLALVGDLTGYDVRAMVASVFASLPGGAPLPDTVSVRLKGSLRALPWKNLSAPAGVVAAEGPALADTLHPAFYLGVLVTGAAAISAWGPPQPPLVSRFQYSLYDEPELVRFYPPVPADTREPSAVSAEVTNVLSDVGGQMVTGDVLAGVRRSVRWLLGGELPPEVSSRLATDTGGLATLSNGYATRALWLGDAFWATYLKRFDRCKIGHSYFHSWLEDPVHQTALLLTPIK